MDRSPSRSPPICFTLNRGAWKTATFKKYNFEAEGILPSGGALHPLLKVREEIRNIFLEMGYGLYSLACHTH